MVNFKATLAALGILLFAAGSGFAQTDSLPPAQEPDSTPAMEEANTPATTGPTATSDNVRRSNFTTHVMDREPVDDVDSLGTTFDKVFFFTEIVNFEGGSITHRWIYGGETMAEVNFDIGGPRWRVYSSKSLITTRTGEWTVEVVDGQGNVIQTANLVYHEEETPRESPDELSTSANTQE